jgi:N-acetylneuraminic acid mutarotase
VSIAGGTEIGIAGAPWQVEVFAEYSSKKVLACGGAILDATHILTAAHCAYSPETGTRLEASAFVMAAGIAPMTAHEIESNPAAEARFVSAVRVHPMFQYSAGAGAPDDVAVLTLAKALSFDVTVQPIALAPTGASLQEGTAASLTGFGEQQYGVEGNSNLYSLSMTVAFPGRCGGEADAVFVCANSQSGSGCSGDSGSALTDGTPAALVGVMDTIELVSNQYCQAGAGNGFVNTSAPEIRAFIEGSETPPTAPRGGKGASIQGEAKVGAALSCEAGSWSGSPTVSYLFVDSANGLVLQSGASSTYIPTSGDIGRRIYCEVTASNLGGTGMARTSTLLGIREPQPAGGGEPPVAPTASDGRWFPLPAMSEPRARHTATLLGDGDVLIAGGYNGFGPGGGSNTTIGTDQLLDPATGRWLEAAPMLVARSGQTATLLRDGEVLVVGGSEMPEGKESMKTAELYDPARNTWAAAPAPAELLEAQSATLLADGRVLLVGLFKGQPFPGVAGAAIYDPASGNWNRVASPKRFHYGAAVTVLPDGKVMVMGGWHSEEVWNNGPETKFTVFASVEEYDPASDTWSEAAPMSHARADQTATLMPDGTVFVTGGIFEVSWGGNDSLNSLRSTEIYDPQTNSWSARASMLIPRAQDTATLMNDGRVLLVGGYDCGSGYCLGYGGSGDCCGASSAEVYDPASNTWEYTGPVLSGNEHTATLLPEGGVLVTGGNVSPISMYELSSAEIYAARYPPDEPPSSPVVTAVSVPPSIGHLAESHKRWREGPASARISARESKARRARAPLGTTFTFTLNEQATVTFTFVQQLPGRRVKGRCAAPSSNNRHRRACKRTATRGSLTFTGHSGPNTVSFQGRLSRSQKLAPGRYALLITATNAAGLRSTTRPLTFTILDPRPSGGR